MDENKIQCEEVVADKKSKRQMISIIILSVSVLVLAIICVCFAVKLSNNTNTGLVAFETRDFGSVSDVFSYEGRTSHNIKDSSKEGSEITVQIGNTNVFKGTYSYTYTTSLGAKKEDYYICSEVNSLSEEDEPRISLRSDGSISYIGGFVIDTFDFSIVLKEGTTKSYNLGISEDDFKALLISNFGNDFDLSYYDEFVVSKPIDKHDEYPLIDYIGPSGYITFRGRFKKNISNELDIISPEYVEFKFMFDVNNCDEAMLISIKSENPFDDADTDNIQEHFEDRNIIIPSEKEVYNAIKKTVKNRTGVDISGKYDIAIRHFYVKMLGKTPIMTFQVNYTKLNSTAYVSGFPTNIAIILDQY